MVHYQWPSHFIVILLILFTLLFAFPIGVKAIDLAVDTNSPGLPVANDPHLPPWDPGSPLNPLRISVNNDSIKIFCSRDSKVFYVTTKIADKEYSEKCPKCVLPISNEIVVNVSAKQGKFDHYRSVHRNIEFEYEYFDEFIYTATGKPGSEEDILITVTSGKFKKYYDILFDIGKCIINPQFSSGFKIQDGPATVENVYFGSGMVTMNEDGELAGSGTQAIWGETLLNMEGASCKHDPPWNGSSDITFTGRVEDNGTIIMVMDMDSMDVPASRVICQGSDGSGGFPFPQFTYQACKVSFPDFNFKTNQLDVVFSCPGQQPETIPMKIIYWREK